MATNLDQAILDYFRAQQAAQINGGGSGSYIYTDPTTGKQTQAMPLYGQGRRVGEGMDAGYENGPMQGYRLGEYVPGQTIYDNNGRGYVDYNTQGQQIGAGTYEGLGDKTMDFIESALPYLAIATGAGMANAIGGLGAVAPGSDLAAMSGIGEAGLTESQLSSLLSQGGIPGSTVGPNFTQGYTDGGTAGGTMTPGTPTYDPWSTGSAGTPFTTLNSGPVLPNGTGGAPSVSPTGAPNAPPPGTPPGGNSLIPGVSNTLLGTGLTALTALTGSQGTEGQTTERKMDPRLDQYVYGTNGLIPSAAGLLASQMPQAQQVGQQLNTMGTGLLGRGIAPNGFERFTKGRY